jgi:hypothetical protein
MRRSFSLVVFLVFVMSLGVSPVRAMSSNNLARSNAIAAGLGSATKENGTISFQPVLLQTTQVTGTVRLATLIASYFDRQVEEILELHEQEIGFGSLAKALYTAVEAGVSLEEILEMHLQEVGWGEIRQGLGLHPGMPHASLGEIISQGKKGPDWIPPGQRKKMGEWTPPGQVKKEEKAKKNKDQSP